MVQSFEQFRSDYSVRGAWGSALALLGLAATAVAGAELVWVHPSPSSLARCALLALGVAVGTAVVLVAVAHHPVKAWSLGAMALAVGLLAGLTWRLATSQQPSSVLWLVLAAVAAVVALSHFFARPSTFLAVLAMTGLVLGATIVAGQRATAANRLTAARTELRQLMAERCARASDRLAELATAAPTAVPADPAADPTLVALNEAGQWIVRAWPDAAGAVDALRCSALGPLPHPDHVPDQRADSIDPADANPTVVAHATEARVLAVNRAGAELAMARARLTLATGDDARKAAAAEVDDRQVAMTAAADQLGADPPSSSVASLLAAGATAAVATLPVLGDQSVPAELTTAGWLALGVIGLLLLRWLAIHASRRGMGPVTITLVGAGKEGGAGAPIDQELLRQYLARNIPEPGTVPGAQALNTVTDLLAADPVAGAATWGKVATVVSNVFTVPSGYDVTFAEVGAAPSASPGGAAPAAPAAAVAPAVAVAPPEVATAPKPEASASGAAHADPDPTCAHAAPETPSAWLAPPHGVSVFVSDTRSKREVAQNLVFGKADIDPWRAAAYWAAAVILERSIDVAPWGLWRAGSSKALSTYYAAKDHPHQEATTDGFEGALRQAPDNGLLLMEGAALYDEQGQVARSFELALRAATSHHQYLLGRYRLAITASSVAVTDRAWDKVAAGDRQEVLRLLKDYDRIRGAGSRDASGAAVAMALADAWQAAEADRLERDRAARLKLVRFGQDRARSLRHDLRVRRLVPGLLRRSERQSTLALFSWGPLGLSLRRRLRDLARSVEIIAQVRAARFESDGVKVPRVRRREQRLVARAGQRSSGWQLAYNVACLHAVRADLATRAGSTEQGDEEVDKAFLLLWLALERPGSDKLTATWVRKDPDLRPLQADTVRWAELLARLGGPTHAA